MGLKLIKLNEHWRYAEGFPDTRIHVKAEIGKNVTIMESAQIGPGCTVTDKAVIRGSTRVSAVDGKPGPVIFGTAVVDGESIISGQAMVGGNCSIWSSRIYHHAMVVGGVAVRSTDVRDKAVVAGSGTVTATTVRDKAIVLGAARVRDGVICDSAIVMDIADVRKSLIGGRAVLFGCADAKETTIKTALRGSAPIVLGVGNWAIKMVAANAIQIGCKTFSVRQWLDDSCDDVPWDGYGVTPADKQLIRSAVKLLVDTAKVHKPWPTSAAIKDARDRCAKAVACLSKPKNRK